MEIKYMNVSYDVKSLGDEGTFSGYGAIFGNVDLGGDVIKKGAFKKSLQEWKKKKRLPPVIWQHQFNEPIGPHTLVEEDDVGLKTEGMLLVEDIPRARQARALLKSNAIDGLSIGYSVRMATDDRKLGARVLTELGLHEISIVTAAMNPEARVLNAKGQHVIDVSEIDKLMTVKDFEDILREAGFSKGAAVAFVARCKRQGEPADSQVSNFIKQLQDKTNLIRSKS